MSYTQESPTRFVFISESQKDIAHIVDLLDNECSCQNFQFRIKPLLDRGVIQPHEPVAKCKHMKIARDVLCEQLLEELRKQKT